MPANEAPARGDDVESQADDANPATPSEPGTSLTLSPDLRARDGSSVREDVPSIEIIDLTGGDFDDYDDDLEDDAEDEPALDEESHGAAIGQQSAELPPTPAPKPARGFRYAQAPGRTAQPESQPEPASQPQPAPPHPEPQSPVTEAEPVRATGVQPVKVPAVPPQPPAELSQTERDLLEAVEGLRMQVATLSLSLDVDGVVAARKERESLLSQLDDYLLPRLRRRDAPLLAVIGGSTGAGKSTLTNSLVRREVSRSGVLRPTTRSPVLVHHPYDSGAFMSQRILPRLERITSEGAEPLQPIDPHAPRITGLRLVPHDGLTPGMAIIDAPDIDSLVETNRDLAVQLLAAADLWIFVTTAARYADAMPWEMLKQAADRGVAVAVVLDRVPPESLQDLRVHLATRLRDRGLGGAPLFTIPEAQVGQDGFLPERVVQPLLTWLRRVAGDERSRAVIASRTLKGIVGSIPARAELLAYACAAQVHGWVTLHEDVAAVFARTRNDLLTGLTDGSLLSGDVLARWQESIADGALLRRLDGNGSGLSDLMAGVGGPQGAAGRPIDRPVTQAAAAAIQAAVRAAVDDTVGRWRTRPGGAALVEARAHQLRGRNVAVQIESSLEEWRETLVDAADEMVALPTGERSVDSSAAADVLFVVAVDESTGRPHYGNPTVAAARRILSAFAGEESVQSASAAARADLVARAAVLLDQERFRLERLLDASGLDGHRKEALLSAASAVKRASTT